MHRRFTLTMPARINLLGNPSDANEGDFATISMAVRIFARALVEPAHGLIMEITRNPHQTGDQELAFPQPKLPLEYDGHLDLFKGAINRLYDYSQEFAEKFNHSLSEGSGVRLAVWSEVPRQSGLGGSSIFVALILAGLRQFYDLNPYVHNDYVLAELTQRVEACDLGITCGFADRYVPFLGGIAYMDYRGKLHQKDIRLEPYVTYERLDAWVKELPILVITTGIQHESGDVHGHMRPRYLQEYDAWMNSKLEKPPMLRFMEGVWETAWKGKIALLGNDLESFGQLMNDNHRFVNEMMTYCGFTDGAGWANNLFIHTALENGALGAKLTGAGGGGSVFALTRPGRQAELAEIWAQTARENKLNDAYIFQPQICHHGLQIIPETDKSRHSP